MSRSSVRSSNSSVISFELAQYELSQHEEEADYLEWQLGMSNRDWMALVAEKNGGKYRCGLVPVYFSPKGDDGYRLMPTYVGNMVSWNKNGIKYVDGAGQMRSVPLRDCQVSYNNVVIAPESPYHAPEKHAEYQLGTWHADDQVTEGWDVIEA